jgi:hypothetical protein
MRLAGASSKFQQSSSATPPEQLETLLDLAALLS